MSRWSDEQDRGSFVFCATRMGNHRPPTRRGRPPCLPVHPPTILYSYGQTQGTAPTAGCSPFPLGEGRGEAPHLKRFVLGCLHELTLTGTFVVQAAEVEDAMNDDTVQLFLIRFLEELGIRAYRVE